MIQVYHPSLKIFCYPNRCRDAKFRVSTQFVGERGVRPTIRQLYPQAERNLRVGRKTLRPYLTYLTTNKLPLADKNKQNSCLQKQHRYARQQARIYVRVSKVQGKQLVHGSKDDSILR